VADGEVVALAGPNGAGKTTLLRMLATLLRPDAGELTVMGEALPDRARSVRERIGYLGHDPGVYLDLTPWQNLELFGDLHGVRRDRGRAEDLLDRVGLLHRAHDVVRTFSRGMTQRLGIARMLQHDPSLLLLDEPYAGLDARGATLLDAVLAEGRPAVIVTHDLERAVTGADRMVVLRAGRVAGEMATRGADLSDLRVRYSEMVA